MYSFSRASFLQYLPSQFIWQGVLQVLSFKQCHLSGPQKETFSIIQLYPGMKYPQFKMASTLLVVLKEPEVVVFGWHDWNYIDPYIFLSK